MANIDIITNFIMEYRLSISVITKYWLTNLDAVIPAGFENIGYSLI